MIFFLMNKVLRLAIIGAGSRLYQELKNKGVFSDFRITEFSIRSNYFKEYDMDADIHVVFSLSTTNFNKDLIKYLNVEYPNSKKLIVGSSSILSRDAHKFSYSRTKMEQFKYSHNFQMLYAIFGEFTETNRLGLKRVSDTVCFSLALQDCIRGVIGSKSYFILKGENTELGRQINGIYLEPRLKASFLKLFTGFTYGYSFVEE